MVIFKYSKRYERMPEISGYCATKCINRYEEYQSGRVDGPKPPPYGNAFQGIIMLRWFDRPAVEGRPYRDIAQEHLATMLRLRSA